MLDEVGLESEGRDLPLVLLQRVVLPDAKYLRQCRASLVDAAELTVARGEG